MQRRNRIDIASPFCLTCISSRESYIQRVASQTSWGSLEFWSACHVWKTYVVCGFSCSTCPLRAWCFRNSDLSIRCWVWDPQIFLNSQIVLLQLPKGLVCLLMVGFCCLLKYDLVLVTYGWSTVCFFTYGGSPPSGKWICFCYGSPIEKTNRM